MAYVVSLFFLSAPLSCPLFLSFPLSVSFYCPLSVCLTFNLSPTSPLLCISLSLSRLTSFSPPLSCPLLSFLLFHPLLLSPVYFLYYNFPKQIEELTLENSKLRTQQEGNNPVTIGLTSALFLCCLPQDTEQVVEALTTNLADKVTVLASLEEDLYQQKSLLKQKNAELEQAINKASSKIAPLYCASCPAMEQFGSFFQQ